jgi:hypothetical protein
VNLTGQGLLASSFHCTVAGDCLLHDESASSGAYGHTTSVNSVYQGFTITGNGATGQNIFHFKDAVNLTVRDVGADGAKNQFTYVGQINVGPQTNHFAPGSVVTHW